MAPPPSPPMKSILHTLDKYRAASKLATLDPHRLITNLNLVLHTADPSAYRSLKHDFDQLEAIFQAMHRVGYDIESAWRDYRHLRSFASDYMRAAEERRSSSSRRRDSVSSSSSRSSHHSRSSSHSSSSSHPGILAPSPVRHPQLVSSSPPKNHVRFATHATVYSITPAPGTTRRSRP